MQNGQKAAFKKTILEKMRAVKKDITSYASLVKPIAPDNAIGRLTRMEAIGSKSINEAALRKAKETLVKLERALITVDKPDFGVCVECEEPIPLARLMVLPETTLCVQCAEDSGGQVV